MSWREIARLRDKQTGEFGECYSEVVWVTWWIVQLFFRGVKRPASRLYGALVTEPVRTTRRPVTFCSGLCNMPACPLIAALVQARREPVLPSRVQR